MEPQFIYEVFKSLLLLEMLKGNQLHQRCGSAAAQW